MRTPRSNPGRLREGRVGDPSRRGAHATKEGPEGVQGDPQGHDEDDPLCTPETAKQVHGQA